MNKTKELIIKEQKKSIILLKAINKVYKDILKMEKCQK